MKTLIQKAAGFIRGPSGETVRYIVIGGCTTAIDYASFYLLERVLRLDLAFSNIASTALAILFAYVTNKLYVFKCRTSCLSELAAEFFRFIASRLFTMVVEIVGVQLFVDVLGQNSLLGKAEAIVIVIILNYILSKFLVFRKKQDK
jgi:putative flippase GtrA